jgi:hypothetical protein
MKIKEHTMKYHLWFDIQTTICEKMGIDEKYFRDYHEIVGGEYKDLWHIWLEYFESEVTNGHIMYNDLGEMPEYKKESLEEDGKEWAFPFVDAVYEVWDDNEIENVKYSW